MEGSFYSFVSDLNLFYSSFLKEAKPELLALLYRYYVENSQVSILIQWTAAQEVSEKGSSKNSLIH